VGARRAVVERRLDVAVALSAYCDCKGVIGAVGGRVGEAGRRASQGPGIGGALPF
jgi:hypothetical protein